MIVTASDLFFAYKQAKAALFYEKRGVGLWDLAKFEQKLPMHLNGLREHLMTIGSWFDELPVGNVWVVPKSVRLTERRDPDDVIRVGGKDSSGSNLGIDVQLRCTPSPEFAIVEVLYLWKFGPLLERLLSTDVLGYRLDVKHGKVRPFSRWL